MIRKATTVTAQRAKLVRKVCSQSFYDFVQEFWEVVVPETPVYNWHIPYLCSELQRAATRVFRGEPKAHDIICNVPPGTTKSTIFSIMFPAWVWTRMPSARCLCSSHTHELVLDLSRKCRYVVRSPMYQAAWPEIALRPDQDTKSHFSNLQGGERMCATVGGANPMGRHAHFLITDDPIDPQQAKATSQIELKAAAQFMTETLPSRKVDKEVSVQFLVMQRLHEADPTGVRLEQGDKAGKVRHICLPARCDEGYAVRPARLAAKYVDGLLDPKRLPHHVLDTIAGELGEYGYAGQFGQAPVPPGGGDFEVDRFLFERPMPGRFLRVVRYWDKAGTADGGAATVGVLMAVEAMGKALPPRYVVCDVARGQWALDKRERMILKVSRMDRELVKSWGRKIRYRIRHEQEPGSGGKDSATATTRMLAGFNVKSCVVGQSEGNKQRRAEPYASQVNSGNVVLWENPQGPGYQLTGPWQAGYMAELRTFPRGRFADQVDASSGAFNEIAAVRRKLGAI